MAVLYLPPSKTYFFTGTTTERNSNALAKVPGSRWFDTTNKNFYIYDSTGWIIETEYKPCVCNDVIASGNAIILIKSSDQIATNTLLVEDTDLKYTVAPNDKLAFTLFMVYLATPETDFAYTLTAPAGAQLFYEGVGADANMNLGQMGALSAGDLTVLGGAGETRLVTIRGSLINGNNGGILQLKYAQASATSNVIKLQAGSWLQVFK